MTSELDPYRTLIDTPSGNTPDWEHPLHTAALAQAVRDAELEPVELGPDNIGYKKPVDPRFIDSRPNPLEGLID